MRRRNWPVIITGLVLLAAAVGFFSYFHEVTVQVNDGDPFKVMEGVRQVSAAVGGFGIVVIIFGLIRR